jgi:hypothetical protein
VANHPEGIPLPTLLEEVHGEKIDSAGDSTAYQRARRLITQNPDFFEVEDQNGLLVAHPQFELLSLILRGIVQRPGEKPATSDREFCEQVLRNVTPEWYTNDDGSPSCYWDWGDDNAAKLQLEQAFSDYLERINDLNIVLEAQHPNLSPEYLRLPYRTRFNDKGRINKQWSIQSRMFDAAAKKYEKAVMLTLTIWPGHYQGSSLWEAIAGRRHDDRDDHLGINRHWNRFMSWLDSESRLGYRPDYLKVLEWQDNGSPHIHAIVFLEEDDCRDDGKPYLVDKSDLEDRWSEYTGGYICDIQPLIHQDDLGENYDPDAGWVRWRDDGNHGGMIDEEDRDPGDGESALEEKSREGQGSGQTAGQYLGKYLSAVYGGILDEGTDADTSESSKYDSKAETWKLALYWATRRKIRTWSQDLRDMVEIEDDSETVEAAIEMMQQQQYAVVGAWKAADIPMHIYRSMKDLDSLMTEDPGPPVTREAIEDPPPSSKSDLHEPPLEEQMPQGMLDLPESRRG